MQNLSIGAVSKLTAIPPHTLRKWESRHGIATPIRTDTGRRVYTDEHIEVLKLVKVLVERRHALAQLSGLSVDELRELANLHETSATAAVPSASIALIGPTICHLLIANSSIKIRDGQTVSQTTQIPEHCDTLILERDTLPADIVDSIVTWAEEGQRVLVVYRHAPRRVIATLESNGIECIAGPITDELLTSKLSFATEEDTEHPPARFSTEELARIAALTPGITCECPNHIAKLLLDISSFEQYSQDCVDTDPKERALHQALSNISAQARQLFEDALVAVATADGLRLNQDA